jgi:hypothetical protein
MFQMKLRKNVNIFLIFKLLCLIGYITSQGNSSTGNVTTWTVDQLTNNLETAFTPIFSDFIRYNQNKCVDSRIPSLFNLTEANSAYSGACVSLVYDWAQVYSNYTCNSWMCNEKGKCSFEINQIGYVNPQCSCYSGYTGKNCMFSQENYEIIKNWLKNIDLWANYQSISYLNNISVASKLIRIYGALFPIISNLNLQDVKIFESTLTNFASTIYKTFILVNNSTQMNGEVLIFLNTVLLSTYTSISNQDPFDMPLMYNGTYENSAQYGIIRESFSPGSEISMTPASGVNRLRFLSDLYKPTGYISPPKKIESAFLNYESPSLFIPAEATTDLAKNFNRIAMTYVRNPKPYYQVNGPAIMSQVVKVVGIDGNQSLTYVYNSPKNPLKLTIPWSDLPFKNENYIKNCKVYELQAVSNWFETDYCTILPDTNDKRASLTCKKLGTFGVACLGSHIDQTLSSEWVSLPSLLLAFLLLLIN